MPRRQIDLDRELNRLIGKRIREQRKLRGLTQAKFGACANVTPAAVAFWEHGARSPATIHLIRLCAAHGIDVRDLVGEAIDQLRREQEPPT